MTKMTLDNNVTDQIGAIYVEKNTKLLLLIGKGVVYDKNDTKRRCDPSYKFGLHRKWNQSVVTD